MAFLPPKKPPKKFFFFFFFPVAKELEDFLLAQSEKGKQAQG